MCITGFRLRLLFLLMNWCWNAEFQFRVLTENRFLALATVAGFTYACFVHEPTPHHSFNVVSIHARAGSDELYTRLRGQTATGGDSNHLQVLADNTYARLFCKGHLFAFVTAQPIASYTTPRTRYPVPGKSVTGMQVLYYDT